MVIYIYYYEAVTPEGCKQGAISVGVRRRGKIEKHGKIEVAWKWEAVTRVETEGRFTTLLGWKNKQDREGILDTFTHN